MNKTKRYLIAVLVLLVVLTASAACAAGTANRSLTLMVYLCGSNLESDNGAAMLDFQEIEDACKGNRNVSVLVMTGGSKSWTNGSDPSENTVWEIGYRGPRTIRTCPAMNMGDPETLSGFLRYVPEVCPADNYALILWDHGGGPLEGVCYDELNGMDRLSLGELDQALANSPFSSGLHLSWIGFDACLMASVETASCCAPYADYMIASQETEPVDGWNYSFLSRIGETYDPVRCCQDIVNTYMAGKDTRQALTVSMVDLTVIPAIQQAANQLFQKAGNQLTSKTFSMLSNARRDTRDFGRASTGSEHDLADLYDLSVHLAYTAPKEASDLQSVLEKAIICKDGNLQNAHGLSVYSPYYNHTAFCDRWLDTFLSMNILPGYQQFLEQFGSFWNGKPLADWFGLTGWAEPLTEHSVQSVFLNLTDAEANHFASASVVILEDIGSEIIYDETYLIHDVEMQNNRLKADYNFEALYAVSSDGSIMTEPVPFTYVDGYYLVEAVLMKFSLLNVEIDRIFEIPEGRVILQCVKTENDELDIVQVIPVNNDQLNLGRQNLEIDPDIWPYTLFRGSPKRISTDENGSLLPFTQWRDETAFRLNMDAVTPEGNIIPFDIYIANPDHYDLSDCHMLREADNRTEWKLKFLPRKSTGVNIYAQFLLNDTQGNQYGSSLIPLNEPNVVNTAHVECAPFGGSGVTLQPDTLKLIRDGDKQELCLRVRVSNDGSTFGMFVFEMMSPIINGMQCLKTPILIGKRPVRIEDNALVDVHIDITSLPPLEEKNITSISFIPAIDSMLSEATGLMLTRVEAATEMDVSEYSVPSRPGRFYISEDLAEGVLFQLLSLKESEDGSLTGTMHMINQSGEDRRIRFLNNKDFNLMVCYINGINCYTCDMPTDCFDIPNGKESYVDFTICTDSEGRIPAYNLPDELPNSLQQILQLGFPIATYNRIDIIDGMIDAKLELEDLKKIYFNLRNPIFLKQRIQFRTYPDEFSPERIQK